MLETVKDSLEERLLRSLAKLELGARGLLVDVLNPVVVSGGIVVVDVILEGDQVGVGDGVSINRGDERSGIVVDALVAQGVCLDDRLCSCQQRQEGETSDALHNGGAGYVCGWKCM